MARKSIIYSISKEEFQELIDKSSTMTDVLAYFNLKNVGGNYKTANKRIEEEGIDISSFNERRNKQKTQKMISQNRIPNEEIFIKDSSYNTNSNIKKRIIEDNMLDEKCFECGICNEWNGKKLVLQLDHINGESNDNRIENLRFLCPNCHSQTNTYSGRNNKNIAKCKKCGARVHSKSTLCQKCNKFKDRKAERPSKEVLESQIKEHGYLGTGRIYGVSDNAIRKWLKNY